MSDIEGIYELSTPCAHFLHLPVNNDTPIRTFLCHVAQTDFHCLRECVLAKEIFSSANRPRTFGRCVHLIAKSPFHLKILYNN